MDPFINTVCQLRAYHSCWLKLCWLNAGAEEFPPIVQLNIVRITMLSRRDANNTQGILFNFLDHFALFPCEWSDVPVTSLWQDYCFRVAFKSLEYEHSVLYLLCFPDNKTGLILIFTPKFAPGLIFGGVLFWYIKKWSYKVKFKRF